MSRLQRLKKLVEPELDALPDRPVSPISDDTETGGVSLTVDEPSTEPEKPPQENGITPAQQLSDSLSPLSLAKNPFEPEWQTEDKFIVDESESLPIPPPPENHERRFVLVSGVQSAWNTGAKLPPVNLQRGQLSPARQSFCPVVAISRFPYKFLNQSDSQKVATKFFDGGKFWKREWDLFYLWGIVDTSKPLILVREEQVQTLLQEINREFRDVDAKIRPYHREEGLAVTFPDHPRLTPRYLGRSSSKDDYEKMSMSAPGFKHRMPGEPHANPPDERTLEGFKQMFEEAQEISKAKKKATAAKRKQERAVQQLNMTKQLKRAQRYLGLRPKKKEIPDPLRESKPLEWKELQEAQAARYAAMHVPPVQIDKPTPHPFDSDVIFVCADVEAYERNHRQITELGISTLDTRDLVGVAPGKDGVNWRDKIRSRHFRIREHMHLNNTEFIQGAANKFDFGKSEIVSLKEAPAWVESCFHPPFSSPIPETELSRALAGHTEKKETRNIIFLGHDAMQDIQYLQQVGYNPLILPNILETLDTAVIYRVWKRDQCSRSLGKILYDFEIAGYNLHNAGNDACFTMQAMLAICVREAELRGGQELKDMREKDRKIRLLEATNEAQTKAYDETEGWSSGGEGDDGGAPEPTVQKAKPENENTKVPEHSGGQGSHQGPPAPNSFAERGGRGGFSDRGGRGKFSDRGGRGRGGRFPRDNFHGSVGFDGYFSEPGNSHKYRDWDANGGAGRGKGRGKGRGRGPSGPGGGAGADGENLINLY